MDDDTPQNRNINDDQPLISNYAERDPNVASNSQDQEIEQNLFHEALSIIELHNQIRHSFEKDMPAIRNFGNLEMFLEVVNANYNPLEPGNVDVEIMDRLDEVLSEAGTLFERIELTRRLIMKDIKYLRRMLRRIRNGSTGAYSCSVTNTVSRIYQNLILNNDSISEVKSKRAEYFSIKCYVLSQSIQS